MTMCYGGDQHANKRIGIFYAQKAQEAAQESVSGAKMVHYANQYLMCTGINIQSD